MSLTPKTLRLRLPVALPAALALVWPSLGLAQSSALPAGMAQQACTAQTPPSAAERSAAMALLKPGPLDPALLAPYLEADAVRARAQAQKDQRQNDWPNLCRYQADNRALQSRGKPRVVFIGASIVQLWQTARPEIFTDQIIDRGISGQTSPQVLGRFYADVIALKPKVVHILVGTNDASGATGPTSLADYQANITAMADIAQANGVRVVLGAIPPAAGALKPAGTDPSLRVVEMNRWLARFAHDRKLTFVDYYSALAGPGRAYRPDLSNDGVHPNANGYALISPMALAAVNAP
jgi:lysophospholipase L1-like esterase